MITYINNEFIVNLAVKGTVTDFKNQINDLNNINPNLIWDAFSAACISGNINTAKYLFDYVDCDDLYKFDDIFYDVCYNGHLNIAKWMYAINKYIVLDNINIFQEIVINEKYDVAKWIIMKNKKNDNFKRQFLMLIKTTCCSGQLNNLIILHKIFPDWLKIIHFAENILCIASNICNLDIIKWILLNKPNVDITAYNYIAIKYSIINNTSDNFEIFNLLLSKLNIEQINNAITQTLYYLCIGYNISYLLKLKQAYPLLDISCENYKAFIVSCENYNYSIIKHFQEMYPTVCIAKFNTEQKLITYYIQKQLPIADVSISIKLTIDNNDDKICCICMNNKCQIQTNCGHNYCHDCLTTNYNYSQKCPMCRTLIVNCHNVQII